MKQIIIILDSQRTTSYSGKNRLFLEG